MVAGPTLILMNNYILNDISFKYPVMLSSLGILTSAIIIHALAIFKYITIRQEIRNLVTFKFLVSRIGIISLLQALTLNFGNLVYTHLSVSLIQMLKAFTPVMTLVLTFMTGQAEPNRQLIGSIFLLSIGTFITSANVSKADASTIGFIIMAMAEGCEALKLVLSQKLMQGITIKRPRESISDDPDQERQQFLSPNTNTDDNMGEPAEKSKESEQNGNENIQTEEVSVKFTVFEGLYYYAPMTFLCQCCLSLPMEYGDFSENWDRNMTVIGENWMKFVICGCLGFSVNMAGWLVTKITSGLYLKALGTFRNICLVVVSALFFCRDCDN